MISVQEPFFFHIHLNDLFIFMTATKDEVHATMLTVYVSSRQLGNFIQLLERAKKLTSVVFRNKSMKLNGDKSH